MELFPLIAIAAVAAGVAVFAVRWWTWRPIVKRRVLVQTDSDVSFDGILMSRRGQLLILADVTVRTESQARVDGLVVVERSRVIFVQRVA